MTDPARRLVEPHLLVMLVLFAGAALAGFLLLPGDAERVAMLERDGNNGRALYLLEQRFAKGDRSQRTLYQLEQLYQHFGNLPKARQMLELLASSRPRDLVLQKRLVKFYRDTQDTEAYLAGLSRLVSRRYSEASCRELIAQLRLVGQFAREREAIERCRLKGYRREDDIVRLAELEAVSGDRPKALALLRNIDDVRGIATTRERLMLTSLLLSGGATGEVSERAVTWLKAGADISFAGTLMEFLGRQKAHDTAIDIARRAGKPGDVLSLWVAEMMLDRDQTSAARAYLIGWLERSEIREGALASRFISAALDAEAPDVALLAAQRFGMKQVAEVDLVRIAEALGATGRRDEFEVVRAALDADTIVSHPLLGAMVELNKGATATTRELLEKVPSEALDTWRLALWARLMRETGRGATADAKLRELGVQTGGIGRAPTGNARVRSSVGDFARRKQVPASLKTVRSRPALRAKLRRVKEAREQRAASGRAGRETTARRSRFKPGLYIDRPKPLVRPLAANGKSR